MLKKSILNGVVYPNDWSIVNLGKTINIFRGGSPRPIQSYLTSSSNGINWIKIGDVNKGSKYIERTEEKIVSEAVSRSRRVYAGDFILSNSMSFGRPYILNIDGCIHDGWLVLQNYSKSFNKDYLYYALGSDVVISQYISKAAGSSVLNLNKDIVASVNLPCPQIKEQELISKALSDIDNLIISLNMLIEKKKAIKQGTMQELVTGKKRLDGSEEKWNNIQLKELCYIITKQTGFDYTSHIKPSLEKEKKENNIPFIQNKDFNGKNINYNTDFYIPIEVASKFSDIILNEKCLLVSISGCIGNVGMYSSDKLAFIGGAVGIAKFKDKKYIEWVMLYLLSKEGQKQIIRNEKAGAQHNITVEDIRKLNIPFPNIEEQNKICSLIFNMDSEIKSLERKLFKYRQIKQGMMQELLTGRIRLI